MTAQLLGGVQEIGFCYADYKEGPGSGFALLGLHGHSFTLILSFQWEEGYLS